jgi:hypothetical protein
LELGVHDAGLKFKETNLEKFRELKRKREFRDPH